MGGLAENFGERIRSRRIEAGMTQARLAHAAGVSRRHLAALEKGANVSVNILARVSEVLVIPPAELFQSQLPSSFQLAPRYASVFISYGTPDEVTTRRIYDDLTAAGVRCFFFPVSAVPGTRLHRTMAESIRFHDRVILLCSAASLARPGVSNEIEPVLAREADEGGSELIIPIALDDVLFGEATALRSEVVVQIRQRVIADFRDALTDDGAWGVQLQRVLTALKWH